MRIDVSDVNKMLILKMCEDMLQWAKTGCIELQEGDGVKQFKQTVSWID